MKVIFVHKSPLGGFGEAAIHYYPACLAELGHDVIMIALAGGGAGFFENHGVRVIEIDRASPWLKSVSSVIKNEQPEIVHIYLYSGCGLIPLAARKASSGSRFVMDIRSPLLRTGTMRLLHRLKNIFEPLFFDAIASHGVESAWTQIGRRGSIHWLPPGVDLSLISPSVSAALQKDGNQPYRLVYIGSLDSIRKVDLMLEAFVRANEKRALCLDIYGDGNLKRALESVVQARGLGHCITFMGKLDRQQLFELLPSYDAGLAYIPGGIYDTAPALKTLEYLASGLPVVATDTLGNRMFIQNGENGLLAGDGVEAYAQAIVLIAGMSGQDSLRHSARESAKAFDWSQLVRERLLPLYNQLLGNNENC